MSLVVGKRLLFGHIPPPDLTPGGFPQPDSTQRTLNDHLIIMVDDERGPGGANHAYTIGRREPDGVLHPFAKLSFQNGGIAEVGVNGLSNESLLAVVIDRLLGFEKGKFACKENAAAMAHLLDAMDLLHSRTSKRIARGVEGKLVP